MLYNVLLLVVVLTSTYAVEQHNKDGKVINNSGKERTFRSGKVQQLWEKAGRMELPSVHMADLYGELKHHDRQLMDLKTLQTQNEDEDGLLQAELQQDFNNIMFKYGMAGNKKEQYALNDLKKQSKTKRIFQDPKLDKLWKETVASKKFSADELEKLFVEFKHHQDKVVELTNLQGSVDQMRDISSNSVEQFEEEEKLAKDSNIRELFNEIDDSYKRLQVVLKKSKDDTIPFNEPRVLELWQMMNEGNFTDEEKQSITDELHHFESRIDKHRHFRDQLKNSADKIDYHGGKHQASTDRLTKHQKLQDKVHDLSDKMHKIFSSLKSRLSGGVVQHSEL